LKFCIVDEVYEGIIAYLNQHHQLARCVCQKVTSLFTHTYPKAVRQV
jgi:hypothetical protein